MLPLPSTVNKEKLKILWIDVRVVDPELCAGIQSQNKAGEARGGRDHVYSLETQMSAAGGLF